MINLISYAHRLLVFSLKIKSRPVYLVLLLCSFTIQSQELSSLDPLNKDMISQLVLSQKVPSLIIASAFEDDLIEHIQTKNIYDHRKAFAPLYLNALFYFQNKIQVKTIYLTLVPIPESYRRYLYRLFQLMEAPTESIEDKILWEQERQHFEKEHFVIVEFSTHNQSKNAISLMMGKSRTDSLSFFKKGSNKQSFEALKDIIIQGKKHFVPLGLMTHQNGPLMKSLSEELAIPLLGSSVNSLSFGKKDKGRSLFKELQLPHIVGTYDNRFSLETISEDILLLFTQHPHLPRKIMLKVANESGGKGNIILDFTQTKNNKDDLYKILKSLLPLAFQQAITKKGAICEFFYGEYAQSSPALMGYIERSGKVHYYYSHQQILEGPLGLTYKGGIGPYHRLQSTMPEKDLLKIFSDIGNSLATKDVRGHFSTDLLLCPLLQSDQNPLGFFLVENNIRTGGTDYPYAITRHLGLAHNDQLFKIVQNVSVSFVGDPHHFLQKFLEKIIQSPIHYNVKTQEGIIITNIQFERDKFSYLVIAKDQISLEQIDQSLQLFLASLD
jgi:hypothetical protein